MPLSDAPFGKPIKPITVNEIPGLADICFGVSQEACEAIDEIEDNIRQAAMRSHHIFIGAALEKEESR